MTEEKFREYERLHKDIVLQAEWVWKRYATVSHEVYRATKEQHFMPMIAEFNRVEDGEVILEYYSGEASYFSFPVTWLWDPDFETKARAQCEFEIEEKQRKKAELAAGIADRELKYYHELKAKYG